MRRTTTRAALLGPPLACLLLAGAAAVHAHEAPQAADAAAEAPVRGDASVRARLDAQGVGYEVDDDGDFRLLVGWQRENRSQLAFIAGTANRIGDGAVREIFSPAARVPEGGLSAGQADMLLRDSQQNVLGAWEIAGDILFYVVKLYDDADGARLQQAIDAAAEIADNMEMRLSDGQDEF
ncbi:hypothetical protein LDO26_01590 [Luteimonas sp. BDR2-5]|uniref:hypothetical protein n=1 Tax=Proluteimonas luteida TaxID=2878685 RepID=UPI001E2D4D9F|nr:hypothetical protein [Luteimonas sp. BDR2-5]MCD9026908.1 hypothetical protein [Luteimonas sp. BDR2-5]